ncbi:MAG: hypothetical protein ACLSA6_10575 [Holdemania massiliensis]
MKKLGLLCTAALLTLSLAACSGNNAKQGGTDNNGTAGNDGKADQCCNRSVHRGLGDKNFNDMSYDGLDPGQSGLRH